MARKRLKTSKGGSPIGGNTAGTPTEAKVRIRREQDYRAEEDFRTLERAEEVRGDGSRHTRALAHGRQKVASMARIVGRSAGKRSGSGKGRRR